MNRRLSIAAAAPLALTLALTGCSGGDDPASGPTVTVTADAPADGVDGEPTDAGTATGAETEDTVAPAEPQTIELNEEKVYSAEDGAYTLTVHRAVINDYDVEVEITIVNDGDRTVPTWFGGSPRQMPQLFDDQSRRYAFQLQAGGEHRSMQLEAGEGMDAVLVFAGRVGPDVRTLTLDFTGFSGQMWRQVTFDIPVGGAR